MRTLLALLIACLWACSGSQDRLPRDGAAAATPEPSLLREPSASGQGLGRVHTLGGLSAMGPLSEVNITPELAAGGVAPPTPAELERLLAAATPVPPDDPTLEAWHYAPWCTATFTARGRRWQVFMYLGGLGLIGDERGRKGMFRFEAPRGPSYRSGT